MPRCIHCAKPVKEGEKICPSCGGEQPIGWMVNLVYILAFLFVQGTVYRLIWPNALSPVAYGAYFAATSIAAIGLLWAWKRFRKDRAKPILRDHEEADSG